MPLFTGMYVKVDGVVLFEQTDVEVDEPDNDQDVDTVLGGRVGVSPGPDTMMISITDALPTAGSTVNLSKAKRNRTELIIEVGRIGNSATISGTFLCRSVNQRSGTAQPTVRATTFSSLGTPPEVPDSW